MNIKQKILDAIFYAFCVITMILVFIMLHVFVLLFIPIETNAQTLKWQPVEKVEGYKIYWQRVKNCNDSLAGDFIYSVNVADTNSYEIYKDYNFIANELYQFRMTAYNEKGIESLQSDVVACAEITGRPDQLTEIEIDLSKKKVNKQLKE